MPKLSQIFIYPVKGLGGISLNESLIDKTGLKYDRRWMLVDEAGTFLSQRTLPVLAMFKLVQTETSFEVWEPKGNECIEIPKHCSGSKLKVKIWDDACESIVYSKFADAWFSAVLGKKCRLVYMPDSSHRLVDPKYNRDADIVSFADAYPILLIGEESLIDLNKRLSIPIKMDRFRPNFVFNGGKAFEEDTYKEFNIAKHRFLAAKPCARCTVPSVNQQTGETDKTGKELLKTLAAYRTKINKVYFGQNLLIIGGNGFVQVGDSVITV